MLLKRIHRALWCRDVYLLERNKWTQLFIHLPVASLSTTSDTENVRKVIFIVISDVINIRISNTRHCCLYCRLLKCLLLIFSVADLQFHVSCWNPNVN
jgi:hypothetical protein